MHLSFYNWGINGQKLAPVGKLHPDVDPGDKIHNNFM